MRVECLAGCRENVQEGVKSATRVTDVQRQVHKILTHTQGRKRQEIILRWTNFFAHTRARTLSTAHILFKKVTQQNTRTHERTHTHTSSCRHDTYFLRHSHGGHPTM